MLTAQPLQCPISLETPPLCPQITPCGHVFSFPSIMAHLMHHGGDNLRKASPCPLCFHPIVARELRLVHIHQVQQPKVCYPFSEGHPFMAVLQWRVWVWLSSRWMHPEADSFCLQLLQQPNVASLSHQDSMSSSLPAFNKSARETS